MFDLKSYRGVILVVCAVHAVDVVFVVVVRLFNFDVNLINTRKLACSLPLMRHQPFRVTIYCFFFLWLYVNFFFFCACRSSHAQADVSIHFVKTTFLLTVIASYLLSSCSVSTAQTLSIASATFTSEASKPVDLGIVIVEKWHLYVQAEFAVTCTLPPSY
jgi:hypothetical protein